MNKEKSSNDDEQNLISFQMMQSKDAYELGEFDQALLLYLDTQNQPHNSGLRPHTLNIFPSQPMHVHPTSKGISEIVCQETKKSSEPSMDLSNPTIHGSPTPQHPKVVKSEGSRKGRSPNSEKGPKSAADPKTLRRLAQNREAAKKSRLRKKAYVQQLESSRIRLTQLEQELQRGFYMGGDHGHLIPGSLLEMEYSRWVEEHHRLTADVRNALLEGLPENEMSVMVENCLGHHDQLMTLKMAVAKTDVFHVLCGAWMSPAERCFMWIGGWRPSHLTKIMVSQIEGWGEEQVVELQQAEETLSMTMNGANHSLSESIMSDSPNSNCYVAVAINNLEALLAQAENLRQQSLQRIHQILTRHQAARCFVAAAEYFHRLRAVSSLWFARHRLE